jgi:integrase
MQNGQIFKRGRSWVLKYYEPVLIDGKVKKRRTLKRLAPVDAEHSHESDVQHLAVGILAPINARTIRPESTELLVAFIEKIYMPMCSTELRPSTVKSYWDIFNLLQPYLNGTQLRDVRTSDIDRILGAVAHSKPRAKTTLTNCRNFLSGTFRYAIRTDRFSRENPVREAKVPKGLRPKKENTYAYNLDEVTAMLSVLPEPARTAVLVASFTGLRHTEIRGLKWQDFVGDELRISRNVWGTWVSDEGETKTESSAAPVPVVPFLKKALEQHRKTQPSKSGFIFEGRTGRPLVLANVLRRDIKPALDKAKVAWHGWHAFRRGVGSILYELGTPDKVIQDVLRHANVTTTQTYYIKTASPASVAAMRKLEKAFKATAGR